MKFTFDMMRACALKCPLKLPKHDGPVSAASGNWWMMPAKNEAVWKFTKMAKKDIFERELRGGSYAGDMGHVVIGGHRFTYYKAASALVRDDFASWCESNWHKVLNADGSERESNRPLRVESVEVIPVARHALDAKPGASFRIDNTPFSTARHYGGFTYNGERYTVFHFDGGAMIGARDDFLKWLANKLKDESEGTVK